MINCKIRKLPRQEGTKLSQLWRKKGQLSIDLINLLAQESDGLRIGQELGKWSFSGDQGDVQHRINRAKCNLPGKPAFDYTNSSMQPKLWSGSFGTA